MSSAHKSLVIVVMTGRGVLSRPDRTGLSLFSVLVKQLLSSPVQSAIPRPTVHHEEQA